MLRNKLTPCIFAQNGEESCQTANCFATREFHGILFVSFFFHVSLFIETSSFVIYSLFFSITSFYPGLPLWGEVLERPANSSDQAPSAFHLSEPVTNENGHQQQQKIHLSLSGGIKKIARLNVSSREVTCIKKYRYIGEVSN